MDLKRLYTDYKNSGAFRGEQAFYKFVKQNHPNVSRKEIHEFLLKTDSYTLHKPRRRVKKHRRIYAKGIGYQQQMDLVDLLRLKAFNSGYCYMLNIIGIHFFFNAGRILNWEEHLGFSVLAEKSQNFCC